MALFRVPSKKIQYGYVEVNVTTDGISPEGVAKMYMDWVSKFQMAEIEYVEAKASLPKDFPEADEPEPTESEAVDNIVDGLGATEVPEEKAPWEKPAAQAATKQPWEVEAPVAAFDWN